MPPPTEVVQQPSLSDGCRTTRVTTLGDRYVTVALGDPRRNLALLANAQRGRVARHQLIAAGWTERMIRTALANGQLSRVHGAVYLVGHQTDVELGREIAALLAVGDDAVLTGVSVLMAHRVIPPDPARSIDVATIGGRQARNRDGITVHRYGALIRGDLRFINGVPMTTVERALLDAAAELTPRQLEHAVDEALARRLTSRTKIRELLDRTAGRAGQKHLKVLLDARRPSSRTVQEAAELALTLIREAGLPEPATEVSFDEFRADFHWRRAGVVFEVDSYSWHGLVRSNFNRDRRKDRIFRRQGLIVVRASYDNLKDEPLAVIADLAATIAEGLAARQAA